MPLFGVNDAIAAVMNNYLAHFSGQDPRPAWLHALRQRAYARFHDLGFPTLKTEGWRQTNISALTTAVFEPCAPPPPLELVPRLRELDLPGVNWGADALRLVFLNGEFAPGLSSLPKIAGLRAGSLAGPIAAEDAAVLAQLEHEDEFTQPFVQLNTAFLRDGAFVELAPGTVLEQPISILHVTFGDDQGTKGVAHPRTLILAGRESQAAIIETTAGLPGQVYFANAVTTIEVGANAALEYVRLEQDSPKAYQIAKLRSRQGRDSRFSAHTMALGGTLVRNNVHAILDGENAVTLLNGLYALDGAQHVDNSTVLDHAQPLGTSREYYKGVLDGKAVGVFNGRIIVRPGAQHTDAIQSNKNLLLSGSAATSSSQPQLEIYADDVRCTHGATVGQLDPQALFYLRSRGLGQAESRKLLVYAFAADVLSRVQAPGLRAALERLLWKKMGVDPSED